MNTAKLSFATPTLPFWQSTKPARSNRESNRPFKLRRDDRLGSTKLGWTFDLGRFVWESFSFTVPNARAYNNKYHKVKR